MGDRYRGFVTMLACALGAAALFWLLRDHWGHTLGLLPYFLFLTCPLIHLFMHHENGGHHHAQGENLDSAERETRP